MNGLIKVIGLPVSKIFYNDSTPNISNGLFQIINETGEIIQLKELEVKISALNNELVISDFFIYNQPDYTEIQKSSFDIKAFSKQDFDISFPPVSDVNLINQDSKVVLSVTINNENYLANSKINFNRRLTINKQ